jgi:hypothetical protein
MNDLYNVTCEHCIFFRLTEDKSGNCWRNPPTPLPMLAPQPGKIQVDGPPAQGVAILAIRPPVTTDTLACGEYDDGSPELQGGPGGTD